MNEFSKKLLKSHYVRDGETIEDAFKRACNCFSNNDKDLAKRLYSYIEKDWFMFSSPVLSNAINKGEKVKGLPISCFLTYVDDTIKGLCDHTTELRYLSVKGGGVGGHWSKVRSMDKKTPGPISFLHTVDADMTAYRQGSTRRGSYAAYIDISHPDIIEFTKMRTPSGDINRKNLNLHHGINITDDFLVSCFTNLDWDLIDPHSKEVIHTIKARELWETILDIRFRTGEPYLNFIDEANRKLPDEFKKDNLTIKGSNLCNEIHLVTDNERSAVCCLSSVNLAKYDEWKDTEMVQDLIYMLDNVLDFFIENAPIELAKTVKSAIEERSIGLGAMGFHDYLQSKMIPFESSLAISTNRSIFKNIKEKAVKGTELLWVLKGACKYSKHLRRNSHLLAIAPNANSSIILNTSPSIEPRSSNAYTHKTRVGSHLVKNKYLDELIMDKLRIAVITNNYTLTRKYKTREYFTNYKDMQNNIWKLIIADNGSIQNIDIFTEEEKKVFKTAFEIDQRWVVDMAKSRQEYICQGQSVNLFFPSGTNKEYYNKVHLRAFTKLEDGFDCLKGLYYLRTESSRKTENVSLKIQRDALKDGVNDVCVSCEG